MARTITIGDRVWEVHKLLRTPFGSPVNTHYPKLAIDGESLVKVNNIDEIPLIYDFILESPLRIAHPIRFDPEKLPSKTLIFAADEVFVVVVSPDEGVRNRISVVGGVTARDIVITVSEPVTFNMAHISLTLTRPWPQPGIINPVLPVVGSRTLTYPAGIVVPADATWVRVDLDSNWALGNPSGNRPPWGKQFSLEIVRP